MEAWGSQSSEIGIQNVIKHEVTVLPSLSADPGDGGPKRGGRSAGAVLHDRAHRPLRARIHRAPHHLYSVHKTVAF